MQKTDQGSRDNTKVSSEESLREKRLINAIVATGLSILITDQLSLEQVTAVLAMLGILGSCWLELGSG